MNPPTHAEWAYKGALRDSNRLLNMIEKCFVQWKMDRVRGIRTPVTNQE